jgi:hypothetical protein
MRSVPLRTARTLVDVLAAAPAGAAADADLPGLRAGLEAAARDAAAVGGWHPDDPLRLTKAVVADLLRCPRRALAPAEGGVTDDVVAGLVVDAAAKLATLVPHRPPTVEDACAYLRALGDTTVDDHLADRGEAAEPLRAELRARVERLVAAWPRIDPAWWPRVEDPVRVRLADGAVTVGGRIDVVLGGAPTERPAVLVEVKGGRWWDGMRADAHLYALVVALRDGRPPAAVVTVVADGTTQVEPVRPAVLATAADRVERALATAAALAAGETPATRPGPHCDHCPARAGCPAAGVRAEALAG